MIYNLYLNSTEDANPILWTILIKYVKFLYLFVKPYCNFNKNTVKYKVDV